MFLTAVETANAKGVRGMARLLHYAEKPTTLDMRNYEQAASRYWMKPRGLWVSVEGEDDWPTWCRSEQFRLAALDNVHEVVLKPDAHVLTISSKDELIAFTNEYSAPSPNLWGNDRTETIDWWTVATRYGGIIIAPYQWSCRFSLSWYYGWDVASGCIWDIDAIESFQNVKVTA